MPYKFAQTQPSSSQLMPDPSLLTDILISPEGLAFLACIGGLGAVSFFGNGGGGKKNKLASGRWAGATEKKTAIKLALQQMQRRKYNEAAVCMERPGAVKDGQIPLMLPDMQRGCAIMGGPGTGKSFVGNLPIVYSYIDQGLSLAVYDFKYPDLTAQIAGYAAQHGYEIYVLAPGYPESHVCNPLDFIERKDLTIMAAQFAEVLNRNFKKGDQKNSDQFFSVAADQLVQGVVQLALETDFPDLIMAQAILSLPNLTKRLEVNKDNINFLTYLTFSTLLASAQSEKTVSSIIAVAANNFTTMMKPSILSALCGKSTLPTRIEGKKLVIFGLDREKRDVLVAPIATLIDMLVNCNVAFKRKNPLALVIDEAPTINLPRIINWLNEMRSIGLCTMITFQNIVQMEQMYGKELTKSIWGGCANKMIFNPQEYDSAKLFADYLGSEEIHYKQKSRSTGKGGGSTNISDQNQTKNLIDAAELLQFDQGERIVIAPGLKSKGKAYIPLREKVVVTDGDLFSQTLKKSEQLWNDYIRPNLIAHSKQTPITVEQMKLRMDAAYQLLPLPDEKKDSSPNNPPQQPFRFDKEATASRRGQ